MKALNDKGRTVYKGDKETETETDEYKIIEGWKSRIFVQTSSQMYISSKRQIPVKTPIIVLNDIPCIRVKLTNGYSISK